MEAAIIADTVKKAMVDAGLGDNIVSAFDVSDLLTLHAGGFRTSISFKRVREKDLTACGIPPGLIGVLIRGARIQGEHLSSSTFPVYSITTCSKSWLAIMTNIIIFHKPEGMGGGGVGASRGEIG